MPKALDQNEQYLLHSMEEAAQIANDEHGEPFFFVDRKTGQLHMYVIPKDKIPDLALEKDEHRARLLMHFGIKADQNIVSVYGDSAHFGPAGSQAGYKLAKEVLQGKTAMYGTTSRPEKKVDGVDVFGVNSIITRLLKEGFDVDVIAQIVDQTPQALKHWFAIAPEITDLTGIIYTVGPAASQEAGKGKTDTEIFYQGNGQNTVFGDDTFTDGRVNYKVLDPLLLDTVRKSQAEKSEHIIRILKQSDATHSKTLNAVDRQILQWHCIKNHITIGKVKGIIEKGLATEALILSGGAQSMYQASLTIANGNSITSMGQLRGPTNPASTLPHPTQKDANGKPTREPRDFLDTGSFVNMMAHAKRQDPKVSFFEVLTSYLGLDPATDELSLISSMRAVYNTGAVDVVGEVGRDDSHNSKSRMAVEAFFILGCLGAYQELNPDTITAYIAKDGIDQGYVSMEEAIKQGIAPTITTPRAGLYAMRNEAALKADANAKAQALEQQRLNLLANPPKRPDIQPNNDDLLTSFIEGLPINELHMHLDGALTPELMFEIAEKNSIELKIGSRVYTNWKQVEEDYKFNNLQEFLEMYFAGANVMRTKEDFCRLASNYLDQAATQHVMHTEMFVGPQTHTIKEGVTEEMVFEGTYEAMKNKAGKISSSMVLDFQRDYLDPANRGLLGAYGAAKGKLAALLAQEPFDNAAIATAETEVQKAENAWSEQAKIDAVASAHKTLQAMLNWRKTFEPGGKHAGETFPITAVGLDYKENGFPPKWFKEVFEKAKEAGLKVTCHAGEEGPAWYLWDAIDAGATRIDHGNAAAQPGMEGFIDYCAKHHIAFNMSPVSNSELGGCRNPQNHPIRKFMEAGITVTVNSDDPAFFVLRDKEGKAIFGTGVKSNFHLLADKAIGIGMSLDELHQLAINSVLASHISQEHKEACLSKIRTYFNEFVQSNEYAVAQHRYVNWLQKGYNEAGTNEKQRTEDILIKLLAAIPGPDKELEGNFVDMGCGDGRLMAPALANHPKLKGIGVDNDPHMIEENQKRFSELKNIDPSRVNASVYDFLKNGVAGALPEDEKAKVMLFSHSLYYDRSENLDLRVKNALSSLEKNSIVAFIHDNEKSHIRQLYTDHKSEFCGSDGPIQVKEALIKNGAKLYEIEIDSTTPMLPTDQMAQALDEYEETIFGNGTRVYDANDKARQLLEFACHKPLESFETRQDFQAFAKDFLFKSAKDGHLHVGNTIYVALSPERSPDFEARMSKVINSLTTAPATKDFVLHVNEVSPQTHISNVLVQKPVVKLTMV